MLASNLLKGSPARRLLQVAGSRANHYVPRTGKWPEPLSQQTLAQFLHDINYFQEPRKLVNIGLDVNQEDPTRDASSKGVAVAKEKSAHKDPFAGQQEQRVEDILKLLSVDAEIPPLNYDDVQISKKQLVDMALNQAIYRDLFTEYQPNREDIHFTQQQADNLNNLIPHHWITDQPYARVDRKLQDTQPMPYFEPLIGISARFVTTTPSNDEELSAHTAYYGNIIPACEALAKPSITLDGKFLNSNQRIKAKGESQFNNWSSGSVESVNFDGLGNSQKFYTIALVNLDSIHENQSNLHWMVSDLKLPSEGGIVQGSNEICSYLPVHGIQGFGYSRYVFLVFQHDSELAPSESKISDFSFESRKFNAGAFLSKHQNINLKPVGLSWFQTTWDISSNDIFHNYINQKAPVFEHVQTKLYRRPEESYPGRRPFHLFMDHYREKKSINEQVLLERLKSVDPTNYKDQYVPPAIPPTVFVDKTLPSWMVNTIFKKKNKIGYWRGLRPASKLIPLNNNVDLDHPIRPIETSQRKPPEYHNYYFTRKTLRRHIVMPYNKPAGEQESVVVHDSNFLDLKEIKSIVEQYSKKSSEKK